MIVNLRYTDDTNVHPFRDANGREGIAVLIFPETKEEKREFQLIRWKLNRDFMVIMLIITKILYKKRIHV